MENAEEVMQILERFTRLKQKEIPKELDDYLQYVAKSGDTVFKWTNLKYLFREKLLNVITHFHDTTRMDEIPQYPNVDPFNYESMKSSLLERLESFNAAPFTIQRLSELLIDPRKQYNRIDKFMRALEKNILVSTVEPGRKRTDSENGDSLDSAVNGDLSLDVNVDIEMENDSIFNMEAQNGNGNISSPADTNNEAETKQTEETETAGKVSPTHEAPHAEDDEWQPSPKKAKLDVVDSTEGTAVATAAETTTTEESVKAAEKETENSEKIEGTKVEESVSKEADEKKNEESDDKLTAEIEKKTEEKPENVTVEEQAKVDTESPLEKEEVQKDSKEKSQTAEQVETAKLKVKESPVETNEKQATLEKTVDEKVEATTETVEKSKEKIEAIASVIESADNKEAEEKVIEKQEIEQCEKEAKTVEVVDNGKEIVNDTPVAVEAEKAAETKVDAVVCDVETSKVEITAAAAAEKVTEVTITPITEIEQSKDLAPAADSEKKAVDADSTVVPEKTDEQVVATPKESATLDTDDSKTTLATNDPTVTVEFPKSPTAKADDVTVASEAVTAPTIVELETAEEPVVAAVPVLPTLALNDQPMDEDANNAANIVDEIVMGESATALVAPNITVSAVEGVEMATDAMDEITTAKADGDTMDVDDTSQQEEAMDQ